MDIRKIADLRRERNGLDRAIAAIESLDSAGRRSARHERSGGAAQGAATKPSRRRRHLSAAARKKLSALLKARWAGGKMGKRKSKAVR